MKTLTITNLGGGLTRRSDGELNSGLTKYDTSWGYDPFTKPGNLTWMEQPSSIAAAGQLALAGKVRLENAITYAYTIWDGGRFSKFQVNKPSTHDPNFDTPTTIGTITSVLVGSVFSGAYGPSLQFFGTDTTTPGSVLGKVFIGHDLGVTKINSDGSSPTYVGNISSIVTSVPRPSAQFLGKTYWGNGNNIMEIDSTETVTAYQKLNPGFPIGTYVRDLDVTPDGNYLQIIVSRLNGPNLATTTQDTTALSSAESYKFLWNGIDAGYTSFESYNGYAINSNTSFGQQSYTLGYDLGGTAIYAGGDKKVSLPNSQSPNFSAVFSQGNMLGFATPEYVASETQLKTSLMMYGQYDDEIPKGLFRLLRVTGSSTGDSLQVPMCIIVSNLFYGARQSAYTNNIVGTPKVYLSNLEVQTGSSSPIYNFYKFQTSPTGQSSIVAGVYETQNQIFSKKVSVKEVRVYTEPLIPDNSFIVDLIGSSGSVLSGGSQIFTVGTNVTAGQDMVQYTPQSAPTYTVGVRITNSSVLGTKNWTGMKIELDVDDAGK